MTTTALTAPVTIATPGRRVLLIMLAGLLIVAVTTIAVTIAGVAAQLRGWYSLTLPPRPGGLTAAVHIAVNNARVALVPLAAAVAVPAWPRLRRTFDVVLGGLLVLNTALVGGALGAYGASLGRSVVVHGTLELAGLAVAGSAYLAARTRSTAPWRTIATATAGSLLLLVLAAAAEAQVITP